MRIFITITIVSLAAILLASAGTFTPKIELRVHQNALVNEWAKYQLLALTVSILTMLFFMLLNPESKQWLRIGQLSTLAKREKWLGINGQSSWLKNAGQLLFFISLGTGIFMFLGLKYSNSLDQFQGWFIPFILIFSFTNSFAEEMIFRFGIIAGLEHHCSKAIILLLSALLFGLPHYFGNPSGIIGVLMSGVLGYILCKATLETKGIAIAWMIHFVQDIIIFTALMMMNIRSS